MKIQELLLPGRTVSIAHKRGVVNPLADEDALQETQLIDVRFDAVRSTVGLLFELRNALQLDTGNTGLLIASGVTSFVWAAPSRETTRTAWTVGGSKPSPLMSSFSIELGIWPGPGGKLSLSANSAIFVVGDVISLDEAPPDYLDTSDAELELKLARWDSEFKPAWASTR